MAATPKKTEKKKPRSKSVEVISSKNWDFPNEKTDRRDSVEITTLKKSRSFDEDYVDVSEIGEERIATLKKFGYINVNLDPKNVVTVDSNETQKDPNEVLYARLNKIKPPPEDLYAKVNKSKKLSKEPIYAKVNKTVRRKDTSSASSAPGSLVKSKVAPKKPKRSSSKTPEKRNMSENNDDAFKTDRRKDLSTSSATWIPVQRKVAPKKPKRSKSKTPEKRHVAESNINDDVFKTY